LAVTETAAVRLDTTDVDRRLGQWLGGGQLKEPCTVTDVRRWVQGMQYPNPLHYDEDYAAGTRWGRIVAPQSFAVCLDVGHGATPAIVGNVPGTHMIFGGDEWWFHGPRIFPGDHLRQRRRFVDYKIAETKFAGPTMFSRGDTFHYNQRGELVAQQRSTAVRYLAEEARRRGFFEQTARQPTWTADDLERIGAQRLDWIRSFRGAPQRRWSEVEVGQRLPTRPIGPHTIQSFATEWRAFVMTVWGATRHEGPDHIEEAGWLPEMSRRLELAELDPSLADGLYRGPSRGHVDTEHARLIGLPRAYGYGASMGAWCLDYVAAWAGDEGFIRHSNVQYRFPPFEGDLTLLNAEVTAKSFDETLGAHMVTVSLEMTNQDGAVMARGHLEVELPE
jgi:acyl dehydratase